MDQADDRELVYINSLKSAAADYQDKADRADEAYRWASQRQSRTATGSEESDRWAIIRLALQHERDACRDQAAQREQEIRNAKRGIYR